MAIRREFDLLPEDQKYLDEYGLPWETIIDGSQWILIHDFPTQDGYSHPHVTAAIRLETGYPQTPLDMVYFFPAINRKDGKTIKATQAIQNLDGKSYQRWSRHRTQQNPWKPGQDNLESHFILIEDWLQREFE